MASSVFIISDSNIFLFALGQELENHFQSVEKCSSFSNFIQEKLDIFPDVVIFDCGNPKSLVEQLLLSGEWLAPAKVIFVMRASQTIEEYREVLPVICALLPDGASVQEIALTARIVGQGISLLPRVAITTLLQSQTPKLAPQELGNDFTFTDREQAVLALISKGISNKLIGRQLDISESTVRVHVRAILRKLGMQNRTQAALYAAARPNSVAASDMLRNRQSPLSITA